MKIGQPGLCGGKGGIGPDSDVTGPTGATGPSPQGPTGPAGEIGETGMTGPNGAAGNAPQGPPGDPGDAGDPLKLAILPSSCGPISLYCIESPQVWLEDFLSITIKGNHGRFPLPSLFLELCEDIFIISTIPNKAIRVWSEMFFDEFELRTSVIGFFEIGVTFRGYRKGFSSRRFLSHTPAEMLHNNAFWRQG